MIKLSTGEDSTLGVWKKMTVALFGEDSPAVAFLDKKIKDDPDGENGEVIMEESQGLYLISSMHFGDEGDKKDA